MDTAGRHDESDEQAVANLVFGLATAIDDNDLATVEALTADMTFVLGDLPPIVGGSAFRRMLERGLVLHDGTPGTQHLLTNVAVTIDRAAGTAHADSYVTVLQAVDGFALQPVLSGRYHDDFAGGAGGWRFVRRHMEIVLRGDTSRHSHHEM